MSSEQRVREGMSRKDFLTAGVSVGVGAALSGLVARNAVAAPGNRNKADKDSGGYGELSPKQAENDPGTYLALPEGFKYTVFGATGSIMSDGNPTPPAHDGMAAFSGLRWYSPRTKPRGSHAHGDPGCGYRWKLL